MNVKILPSISLLIGLAIAIIFVFHPMIISNFRLMPGDVGDERLIMYILNHWYNVFIGHDSFFRLNFLYPDNKVLGYSDALFLFGIIYSFFRMLGYDYFVSVQLLYFFIITFGYCSAFFLFRRILRLNLFFSVAGAIFFVTLNCILNQFGHGQLLGLHVARQGRKGRHLVVFRVYEKGCVIEVLRILHDSIVWQWPWLVVRTVEPSRRRSQKRRLLQRFSRPLQLRMWFLNNFCLGLNEEINI
jgi:hypothetical protein